MIESKENIADALILVKELFESAQEEASKKDANWKQKIGINHDYLN